MKVFLIKMGKQFVKFSINGGFCAGVEFLGFWFFIYFGKNYMVSQIFSYSISMSLNFILNRFWTFSLRAEIKQLEAFKFLVVNIITMVSMLFLIYIFKDRMNLNLFASKILATSILMFFNFFCYKFWVFKRNFVEG
ncbi:GtrA family protein [bacterium]|nr:GtrA family protein [bacterium]MBT3581955.1 GtrA family protein [bacterium]MBT4551692.1 GtrA family protein [bacterium]MBT7088509.1 GtrA family protein [bacterium]